MQKPGELKKPAQTGALRKDSGGCICPMSGPYHPRCPVHRMAAAANPQYPRGDNGPLPDQRIVGTDLESRN